MILFVDEIFVLNQQAEEILYPAMEYFSLTRCCRRPGQGQQVSISRFLTSVALTMLEQDFLTGPA